MSRAEWVEAIAIIGVIVAWWPVIFLGWTSMAYKIPLYAGSFIVLGIILVRRLRRLEEALRYSKQIIDQQHLVKYGSRPPLSLHVEESEDEEAESEDEAS